MVLLALFSVVALPTGGKCFDSSGHLCVAAPDLPCVKQAACDLYAFSNAAAAEDDCGGCRFVAYDNTRGKRVSLTIFAPVFFVEAPESLEPVLPRTVALCTAYFPTGPPSLRSSVSRSAPPRAPPFVS